MFCFQSKQRRLITSRYATKSTLKQIHYPIFETVETDMSNLHNQEKLSSARFSESTDAFVEEFTASIQFDHRMYKQDIQGSVAHAKMLTKVGILNEQELEDIIKIGRASCRERV